MSTFCSKKECLYGELNPGRRRGNPMPYPLGHLTAIETSEKVHYKHYLLIIGGEDELIPKIDCNCK